MMLGKRIVVIGGVAGGATTAARARGLSEEAEILVLERGPHVSFANCGLPYFVGGEISNSADLLVSTPQALKTRFNIDVRVLSEVVSIDRENRNVEVRNLATGEVYRESYDALVVSTGAMPLRPPIPGIDRPGNFVLRNVPDAQEISRWIEDREAGNAVVVGGGYIGLEMAEQLRRRGLNVTLVEALPQVMNVIDPEMADWLHVELRRNGVTLHLNDGVAGFKAPADGEQAGASVVVLNSGTRIPADVVALGLGVKPDVGLARGAGLEIGDLGGIRTNEQMQTSDPCIWAVGDAVEVRNAVTGGWSLIPLAGPANRQGRIAADNIFGRNSVYKGTWGTAILRLFDLTAAVTGATEKLLRRSNTPYEAVHLHPGSHAGYFPGAQPIAMKVLFDPGTGKLLGAQAVGRDGVDKRIDVLAAALQAGMTIEDLADLELAYAPPFGSAKDPVNLAGMIGQNIRQGDLSVAQWDEVAGLNLAATVILDVRQPNEWDAGHIPNALNIPLPELRARLAELPKDKEIVAYCHSGQRSYYACRILTQNGFRCRNLTGAWVTWKHGAAGAG